jgi:hypothetical protein
MLKHMDDNAELNMLIDNAGTLLVVCSKCGNIWKGNLTLAESANSAKGVIQLVETAQKINPSVLKDVGINMENISFLKSR